MELLIDVLWMFSILLYAFCVAWTIGMIRDLHFSKKD